MNYNKFFKLKEIIVITKNIMFVSLIVSILFTTIISNANSFAEPIHCLVHSRLDSNEGLILVIR